MMLTMLTSVAGVCMIVEGVLMLFKKNETFVERIDGRYHSFYEAKGESRYHTYPPNQTHWITKQEYNYKRLANSLGFSDMEWPMKKRKNEKRILALGDSFTEGDGAPYDSSYVSLLRKQFAANPDVYIMNGGTCGSDPFINFVNYKDRLSAYHPDIIIQTLSSGDMTVDLMVRGGMERFLPGGKVQFRKAPWWEPIYALSYISRLYFTARGYNPLLLHKEDEIAQKTGLDSLVIGLFNEYAGLAKKNNCKLLLVIHPCLYEITKRQYQYDFSSIITKLRTIDNLEILDLIPFYTSYINDKKSLPESYYWPYDGHHNSKGYKMMADGVYTALKKDVQLDIVNDGIR